MRKNVLFAYLMMLAVFAGVSGTTFAVHTHTIAVTPLSSITGDVTNFSVAVTNGGPDNITSITINYTNFAADTAPAGVACGSGFARNPAEADGTMKCVSTGAGNDIAASNTTSVTFTKTAPTAPNTTPSQYFFTVTTTDNSGASTSTDVSVDVTDNSAPRVYLSYPANFTGDRSLGAPGLAPAKIQFQYAVTDNSDAYSSCHVYGNFTGSWGMGQANQTAVVSGVNTINMSLAEGTYIWNVECSDLVGNSAFNSTNYTLSVDTTPPSATVNGPTGTQTSANVTLSVSTNETATCKFETSNVAYGAMTSTFSSTGSTSHTSTFSLSNGNYVYYVLCADAVGNVMSTPGIIVFTVAISTPSSEPPTPPKEISEMQLVSGIPAGTTITVTLSNPNIAISSIQLTTANAVLNGYVTVLQSPDQMAGVTASPNGTVFKYLTVTKSGITDNAIGGVKIRFKVNKTWMADNEFGTADVALSRYSDGKWTDLTTRLTNQDTGNYFFEAESPGLSFFAIKASKAAAAPAPETAPGTGGGNETAPTGEAPGEQPLPDYAITAAAVTVLALAAGGIWYYLKSQKEFKQLPWRKNVVFRPHKAAR